MSCLVEYFGNCGLMRKLTDLGPADSGSPQTDASSDSRIVHFGPFPICLENTPLPHLTPDPPAPPPQKKKVPMERTELGPYWIWGGAGRFKGNHIPLLFCFFFSKRWAQPQKGNGPRETEGYYNGDIEFPFSDFGSP